MISHENWYPKTISGRYKRAKPYGFNASYPAPELLSGAWKLSRPKHEQGYVSEPPDNIFKSLNNFQDYINYIIHIAPHISNNFIL